MRSITVLIIILSIIANHIQAQAQNKQVVIYGYVVDINNKPIFGTNIFDKNTQKGTSTDINGFFSFKTLRNNSKIKASHIGYKTLVSYIDKLNIVNDSIEINIRLEPSVKALKPVEISSDISNLVFTKCNMYIYDFQFFEDKIVLFAKEKNKDVIKLISYYGNELLSLELPKHSQELFKDCYGNIHVIFTDSIRQVFISSDQISLTYCYDIALFNNTLKHCAAVTDDVVIFNQYGDFNQLLIYYCIKDKEKKIIKLIVDKASYSYAAKEQIAIIKLTRTKKTYSEDPPLIKKSVLALKREIFERENYQEHILNKPIYNPLFKINNMVYIFDHINDSCYTFNKDLRQIKAISIKYHKSKRWAKELLVDNTTKDIYAKYEVNGIIYLEKIDLNTGDILAEYKVENCIYPRKLKISDGFVFYIKKNENKTRLCKQYLK